MQDQESDNSQKETTNNPDESNTHQSSEDERIHQEGVEGDVLSWLEGPELNAPIEEMPTLQWPDIGEETDQNKANPSTQEGGDSHNEEPVDNLEDAMNWLEELAAGQGTPIDEMPTLISGGQYDSAEVEELEKHSESIEISGKTSTLADQDSDPMAWLEQLAVDQSSPLEELPSVADRLLASEIISQNEINSMEYLSNPKPLSVAIEVEKALKYLEDIAAENGIDLKKVDIEQLESGQTNKNSYVNLDELAKKPLPAVEESAEDEINDWEKLSAQIPEDPDEALAWMGGLAEDGESEPNVEYNNDEKMPQPEVNEAQGLLFGDKREKPEEIEVNNEQVFEGMPDDPDEIMAWMENISNEEEAIDKPVPDQKSNSSQGTILAPQKNAAVEDEMMSHARDALDSGNIEKAAEYFQEILEGKRQDAQVIQALEKALEKVSGSPELLKLLGDAYMQDGQMQKALNTYRRGFDHL